MEKISMLPKLNEIRCVYTLTEILALSHSAQPPCTITGCNVQESTLHTTMVYINVVCIVKNFIMK